MLVVTLVGVKATTDRSTAHCLIRSIMVGKYGPYFARILLESARTFLLITIVICNTLKKLNELKKKTRVPWIALVQFPVALWRYLFSLFSTMRPRRFLIINGSIPNSRATGLGAKEGSTRYQLMLFYFYFYFYYFIYKILC